MQVEALHLDKRALSKVLQQRETELEDLHTRLRQTLVGAHCAFADMLQPPILHNKCIVLLNRLTHASVLLAEHTCYLTVPAHTFVQDKVVALSDTNAALDADAHEARAACSRLQQDKLKLGQQAEVLDSHNKWLEQELASRTEAALQERRALSAQVGYPGALRYVAFWIDSYTCGYLAYMPICGLCTGDAAAAGLRRC